MQHFCIIIDMDQVWKIGSLLHRVPQERPTVSFSASLPNIHRFSKFYHWHILWTTNNEVVVKYPTTL